jgi:hypothetical protein
LLLLRLLRARRLLRLTRRPSRLRAIALLLLPLRRRQRYFGIVRFVGVLRIVAVRIASGRNSSSRRRPAGLRQRGGSN